MKGRRKKLWILLGCAIAAVLILMLWREREPQYNGKSLSQWTALLTSTDNRDGLELAHKAEEAVRQIGTNGLPFLVRWIQYQERPWRSRLGSLCYKLPEKVAGPMSRLVTGRAREQAADAFNALYILGPDAKAAIPVLTNMAQTHTDLTAPALGVLARIGDEGLAPILNVLTNPTNQDRLLAVITLGLDDVTFTFNSVVESNLVACLDDLDPDIAFRAAGILCCHNLDKERVLETLMHALALSENDKLLRQKLGWPLKRCLMEGFSVSTLLQFLEDTNSPLSIYVPGALADMAERGDPLPESVFAALVRSFHDPRPSVRNSAAGHITSFPRSAESAMPALLDLWNDPDESVRQSATNAFLELPSYSVFRDLPVGMSQEQARMFEQRYGVPRPQLALTNLLNHPDIRVRQMATNAFRKFTESPDSSH